MRLLRNANFQNFSQFIFIAKNSFNENINIQDLFALQQIGISEENLKSLANNIKKREMDIETVKALKQLNIEEDYIGRISKAIKK